MEIYFNIHVFLCALSLLRAPLAAVAGDTITADQAIKDGETIVSSDQMYELGFFSPGNSKKRYLGIWFKKISTGTVVWVANRETPIKDSSGVFKVSRDGNLMIFDGGNIVIWSSNSTISMKTNNLNPVAQLLDTGNLVVMDKNSTNQHLIWQSFDYPSDTMLAGMKFGKDLVTGLQKSLTSWKSPDDPSKGPYDCIMDTNGYPQIFSRKDEALSSRLGPWNGLGFSGFPSDIPNPVYTIEFVVNDKEIYNKFELIGLVVQRVQVTWDGRTLMLHWIERIQDWIVYADTKVDQCDRFGACGPFGICSITKHSPCSCIEGFVPILPENWKESDWSSGCQRKKPLDCGSGDGFLKVSGVKLPDTRRSWYNVSMSLQECEVICRRNCSCIAYANLDIRNGGIGCLLWFDGLLDTREYDEGQDIYIRLVASELAAIERQMVTQSGFSMKKRVVTLVLSISTVALLLSVIAYSYRKKTIRPHEKEQGKWAQILDKDHEMENLDDILSFSILKIAKATNNFDVDNKIGEGGFGPVYKGVLEDGREVAVKRLSETSEQGLEEFKNEVICIAKLQHRNLVKLFGYCIHENEMMLIYEYMANKSLDSILFDETKSSMLDWPQRYHIIHGMARGILYLHQDSRLQIIHRDLKAANILLDGDMNPKISDFGLARKFAGQDADAKTKKVVGTYGYISPEYAVHGRFSIKSDVFSFGVLVLEIISGKKNREFSHEDHSDNLLGHAWRLFKDDKSIELVSESFRESCNVSEVLRSIHVGLLCVQQHAQDRPTMLSVVLMLASEGDLPQPKPPGFYTEEIHSELDIFSSVDEATITLLYAR